MSKIIDVWDAATFDAELLRALDKQAEMPVSYFKTDHEIFLSYELASGQDRPMIRPDNPFAARYYELLEALNPLMLDRTIRAFHYTRLDDDEVAAAIGTGIYLSTTEKLRSRLDELVARGVLRPDAADQLYRASPLHGDQFEGRSGKFWMVSHPLSVEDTGVVPLMERWGGEVASFAIDDAELLAPLALGEPRVIEIAVPLRLTRHAYHACKAVVATFARAKGAIPEKSVFDLYTVSPLDRHAILAVHTKGEPSFSELGKTYPAGFIDVDVGRWKELTGEDD